MSLRIACFDTSGSFTLVALADSDGQVSSRIRTGSRGHVEYCLPALTELLKPFDASVHDVPAYAVAIGPGLFTGLRVGVQTAKSLASMTGRPLFAVSSLQVLASSVSGDGRVLACVQAHRGEVFSALFEVSDGGIQRLSDDQVGSPEDAAAVAREHGARLAGNGAASYPDRFADLEVAAELPSAEGLVAAALNAQASGEAADPATLEPVYMRRSEAEIRWGDTGVVAKRPDRVRFKDPA